MKWVLIVVGGLVGLVVLVAIIGLLLPKSHEAMRVAKYRQPSEIIWQAITDYKNFPSWRPDVKSIDPLPERDGRPAWREVDNHGQVLPLEVVEWLPPQRLVTRIAGPKLAFGGTWTFEIASAEGGCTLRITENGEIYNPIFRFMARFVFGYTATMETYLKALGKKFGEDVAVQE